MLHSANRYATSLSVKSAPVLETKATSGAVAAQRRAGMPVANRARSAAAWPRRSFPVDSGPARRSSARGASRRPASTLTPPRSAQRTSPSSTRCPNRADQRGGVRASPERGAALRAGARTAPSPRSSTTRRTPKRGDTTPARRADGHEHEAASATPWARVRADRRRGTRHCRRCGPPGARYVPVRGTPARGNRRSGDTVAATSDGSRTRGSARAGLEIVTEGHHGAARRKTRDPDVR